jgi:hypothetical protein
MKRASWWVMAAVILAAGALVYYVWTLGRLAPPRAPAPPSELPAPAAPAPAPPVAPAIRFPIEAPTPPAGVTAEPLPPLERSDATIQPALARVLGQQTWATYFYPDLIIRHIVATVDNLPRKVAPTRVMPVKPAPGAFHAEAGNDGLVISAYNAARYEGYMTVLRQVSIPALVDVYVRYYPLFQRAYEELGYPNRYFNDRLFEAIDDLLAAPDPEGPVQLVQPKVLYQFADPDLESRSAGQKVMIRIGRDNEAKAKDALKALRKELLRRTTTPEGDTGGGPHS